jgi:hypothetical protein
MDGWTLLWSHACTGWENLDVKDVMKLLKNTTDEQLSVEKAVITPTTGSAILG